MHFQSKLYEWHWEKLSTCCTNTVNSVAECAQQKLAASRRYWVIELKPTVTLTFSDLCVKSSSVGVKGGGEGAVKVRDHMEVCMKSHWRLHTTSQPAVSSLHVWEQSSAPLHERSVFNKGQVTHSCCDNLWFDCLLSSSASFHAALHIESWESLNVCLQGEMVVRIFLCVSNMAIYCCPRWSMLLATFFVFFFYMYCT